MFCQLIMFFLIMLYDITRADAEILLALLFFMIFLLLLLRILKNNNASMWNKTVSIWSDTDITLYKFNIN